MTCPKCRQKNPEAAQFCLRCHMTLHFRCPACRHFQRQGGQCERCGVDFLKYVALVQFQMESTLRKDRERAKGRSALLRQIFLLPVTGGYSLIKYMKSVLLRD